MAPLDELLKDTEYANWVKSGLALNITNEVLRPFVVKEITKLHQSIVEKLPRGVSCTGCNVNTRCPNGICDKIQREIENKHWYTNPSFTNTCTRRWSTEPWEIAKCFMPPSKGCRDISTKDADFTVSINVIINCRHFQAFGTSDPEITETVYSKSRDFRNSVMHASPQKVTENDMRENLDILINILKMIETSETEGDIKEAIEEIEKIKADQLTIKLRDVIELQRTAREAVADEREKKSEQVQRERLLVNFEAGCRKALCRLTEEHISKQTNEKLSVSAFLSKILILSERRDLCLRHEDMLFPKSGTPTNISEWDLFVYCFILKLELYEPLENAASLFVQEVKTIRDKLLLDATGVTQNDLSELCEYLIDTDLNTEITDIFNKDPPDVDVIRSNNNLVAWWRQEEEYENKQVSKKQLNNSKQAIKEMDAKIDERFETWFAKNQDKVIQKVLEAKKHGEENATPRGGANAAETRIGAEAEVRPRGCDEKTGKKVQEHITNSNNNDTEKTKSLNHFCRELNLKDVKTKEGSIILNVTCSSITNVIDFWDSCIDGRAVKALSEVRDYYRRYFNCNTLEFDVILTKKGVSRCVDEIVEVLPSSFEVLVDNVAYKVQEILEAKDMNPTTGPDKDSTVVEEGPDPSFKSDRLVDDWCKGIDIRKEEERTKEEKQIKDITSIPGLGKDSMVADDGSDIMVKSETPSLSLLKKIDIRAEEERITEAKQIEEKPSLIMHEETDIKTEGEKTKEEKQIKGDSVRDIDKHTREEVDRLVKILRQISEDLEGGSIASIKQHVGDTIRYSKDDNEKMIDECNKKFLKQILKSGTSPNLISQAMRGFHMIRHDPSLGDLVQSEIDLIEKEQSAQADVNPPVSEARRSHQFGEKSTVLIEEDIKVDEMDIHSRRLSKYQDQPSSSSSTGDPAIHFKSSGKLSEKDLISKPERRVPTTSKYGHDKELKTKMSQGLSSLESESGTSKLYTKTETKPVD